MHCLLLVSNVFPQIPVINFLQSTLHLRAFSIDSKLPMRVVSNRYKTYSVCVFLKSRGYSFSSERKDSDSYFVETLISNARLIFLTAK
jgi:hypothetical protein